MSSATPSPLLPGDPPESRLLQGPLRSTVFFLALPVLCEQFLAFCVGFYDTWLSGRIDAEATSAIGVASYVGWLASMLFGLIGTGTTALVARHWGAGDYSEANRTLNCSLILSVIAGLITYFGLTAIARPVTILLGMEGSTQTQVVEYLRWDAVGLMFSCFTLVASAALRGSGDMRTPMLILGGVNFLNMFCSSLFVYGWGPLRAFGLKGIVWGTVLARISGGLMMFVVLLRSRNRPNKLSFEPSLFRISPEIAPRILKVGVPAAMDGLLMWCGHFLFLMIIARLGSEGFQSSLFAAHIICAEIEAITYLSAVAWGCAAATIVGQSLGAQEPTRAEQSGTEAAMQGSFLGLLISIVFFFGASEIYSLMHHHPHVVSTGASAFKVVAWFQIPLMVGIIYIHALRGSGDTKSPLYVTLVGIFCFRLPLAYLFGIQLEGGLLGAWIGMCTDMFLRGLLAGTIFYRGKWKTLSI